MDNKVGVGEFLLNRKLLIPGRFIGDMIHEAISYPVVSSLTLLNHRLLAVKPTASITEAHRYWLNGIRDISPSQQDAGGIPESSRWLSAATPPDRDAR